MNKKEYIEWMQTRGPVETWNLSKCREADALIKETAVSNLQRKLSSCPSLPPSFVDWAVVLAKFYFGSVETDAMLNEFGCYEEWM